MRNWKQRNPAGVLLLAVIAGLPAGARNLVTDWTTIASTTIVKNGGKSPGASGVWFAYTSIAMYDAVSAVTGQYRPVNHRAARFLPRAEWPESWTGILPGGSAGPRGQA